MPDCQFNEREFEAAVNHELIARLQPILVGALPTIPSQFEERSLGYDAAYNFTSGKTLFLQYKVAYWALHRGGSNRDVYDAWAEPYFRAEVLMDKKTNMPHQHNLLVDLAAKGERVLYCAPLFHELTALAFHAGTKSLWVNSLRAPLRGLPKLGKGRHSFSYPRGGDRWRVHSEVGDEIDISAGEDPRGYGSQRPFTREEFGGLLKLVRGVLEEAGGKADVPRFMKELGPLAELDWLLSRQAGAVLVLIPDRD
jgi:hypothetical protein